MQEMQLTLDIRKKISKLISLRQQLENQNKQLNQKINELQQKLMEKDQLIKITEEKNQALKLAGTLSGSESENHELKLKINKMIREIDKSLALLNV